MSLNFFSGYLAKGYGSSSFVEINYPGYARQQVDFRPMSIGLTTNAARVAFSATQPWLPITQTALFDVYGNPFLWWNMPAPVTLGAGQSSVSNPGDIALYFDAAAQAPTATLQYGIGAQVGILPGGIAVTALAPVQIVNGVLSMAGGLSVSTLPTTLPSSPGIVWNNGGMISVS